VPAHHNAQEYMDTYVQGRLKEHEAKEPLFRSVNRKREVTDRVVSKYWIALRRMVSREGIEPPTY
jgi:integrase/recombinase XerD